MKLILASQSSYKRELLERLGVSFLAESPDVDERHLDDESPIVRATRLALEKANACRKVDTFSIGADQVIAMGDRVFDKPGTKEKAVQQLLEMQGATHHLHCAVATVSPSDTRVGVVSFEMVMRPFSEVELVQYVEFDNPVDCAGSYKIESRGITLFERIRGDDYTAIVGLPLTMVQTQLIDLGFYDEL